MALTERLALVITGDSKGAVKAIGDVGRAADRDLAKAEKRFERTGLKLQQLGAGAVGLGGLFVAGLSRAGQKAGELEQAVGGTQAVFGEAAGTIDRFAEGAAKSMGLSERAFREATSRIGGSLKGLGFATDDAADQAVRLTGVAADLAATYGGSTADAVDALAAAFRGEADPAERFNLFLNQARVNAKAVSLGLAESTSSVSAHAKAQATLALILEQSADAQGQFARESDTLIGKQQIAAAEAENAAAELGEGFVPVMQTLTDLSLTASSAFGDLNQATGGLAATFVSFGSVALVAGGGMAFLAGTVMRSFDTIKDAANIGVRALQRFQVQMALARMEGISTTRAIGQMAASAINPTTIAITAGVTALYAWSKGKKDARQRTMEFVQALQADNGELGENTDQLIRNKIAQADLNDNLVKAGITYDEFVNALREGGDEGERVIKQLLKRGKLTGEEQLALGGLINAYTDANKELEENAAAGIGAGEGARDAADGFRAAGNAAGSASGEVLSLKDAMDAAFNSMFGLEKVSLSVDKAFVSFNDTVSSTSGRASGAGRSVDLVAKKQEALERATRDAESALESYNDSLRSIEDAQRDLTDAQTALERALRGPSDDDRAVAADDLADARLSLEDATFAVEDAQKRLTEAQEKGDPGDIARAQNDYEQALLRRNRAQRSLNEEQTRYNSIANWTKENDPKVADAQDKVKSAQERLEKATKASADRYRELEAAQKAQDEVARASHTTFGEGDGKLASHRDRVNEVRSAYVDLAEAIKSQGEALIANQTISAQGKINELNRIESLIKSNPSLTPDQKQRLLAMVYSQKASAVGFTPGFMLADGALVKGGRGGVTGTIGEAQHDELVLPLTDRVLSRIGGGTSVQVNINAPVYGVDHLERVVADAWLGAQRRGILTGAR